MNAWTKKEIIYHLNQKTEAFLTYIIALDKDGFEARPAEKWSAGQNLEHLIRSIKPLQPAYSLPKFILKMKFGVANRPSRNYDDLVKRYKEKLQLGGGASGPFIPPPVSFDQKGSMIKQYRAEREKLSLKVSRQNEADLDKYVLPHPLMGKLTMREMLYFTIHHNEHHLKLLVERS